MGPLGTDPKGTVKAPPQHSAQLDTATHSGSRPGAGKTMTESSAPSNPRTLDRNPPSGWLGSGGEKARG